MSDKAKGILCAMTGPLLFGISGTVAQSLFQNSGVTAPWLVSVRLLGSGILMILFSYFRLGSQLFDVWKNWRTALLLVCLAIFGMLGNQLTYFEAIAHSNAGTATVMQFLAPTLIIIYFAIVNRRWPGRADAVSVVLATIGTFLITTHGQFGSLAISKGGLIWGILTALSGVVYAILPVSLVLQFGSLATTSWCMLIGGVGFNLYHPVWVGQPRFTLAVDLKVAFIILFGTMFAYLIFMQSLKYVSPTTMSLLDAFEPVSAAILGVLFLGVHMDGVEILGTLLVISTVFVQAMKTPNQYESTDLNQSN
ncbi:DMT family transporter [Levilactobacillus bambusae]|uniref:Peptide ABC transporter ATP-binding protein n=1 Tax=Levilactobacillus bambusae TaxID=2024736 RepID=A0A2V1N0I7_9LACO|nr:DMT family transporter [Levilactobacillus bambusae]PWG00781.1 peptide ABC transporter ATP-binding protein [Levilactobacillus bambusae]